MLGGVPKDMGEEVLVIQWGMTLEDGTGEGLPASVVVHAFRCLLYTSPSPRDATLSRMPSSA